MWQRLATVVIGVGLLCLSQVPMFKGISTYLLMAGVSVISWAVPHFVDWAKPNGQPPVVIVKDPPTP